MTFRTILTTPFKVRWTENFARLTDIYVSPNTFEIKFLKLKHRASETENYGLIDHSSKISEGDGLIYLDGTKLSDRLPDLNLKINTAFSNTYKKLFYLPKEVYETFESMGLRLPLSKEEAGISEEITKEYAKHMKPIISLKELLEFELQFDGSKSRITDFDIDLNRMKVDRALTNGDSDLDAVNSNKFSLGLIDLTEKTINLDQDEFNQDTTIRRSV